MWSELAVEAVHAGVEAITIPRCLAKVQQLPNVAPPRMRSSEVDPLVKHFVNATPASLSEVEKALGRG